MNEQQEVTEKEEQEEEANGGKLQEDIETKQQKINRKERGIMEAAGFRGGVAGGRGGAERGGRGRIENSKSMKGDGMK